MDKDLAVAMLWIDLAILVMLTIDVYINYLILQRGVQR